MPDPDSAGAPSPASWPLDPTALWRSWWRGLGLQAPLSGDVTQAFDATLVRSVADQLGFVNINTSRAGDPELERRITEQVASYGRQLGQILDAVDVLIRRDQRDQLAPEDERALTRLQELRADVEAVKERAAAERVDRIVADVRTLRRQPEANQQALERIRVALEQGPGA